MDNQTISPNEDEFNQKLKDFIYNLINLNLELVSINPKDVVAEEENGVPKKINAAGLQQLFGQIGKIAKFLKDYEAIFIGELH